MNLVLIVLPLLAYLFYLSHKRHEIQIAHQIERLENSGTARAALLAEEIGNQYTTLSMIADLLNLSALPSPQSLDQKMVEMAQDGDYVALGFFTKTADDHFILTSGSRPQDIGRDLTFRAYVQEAYATGKSAYLASDVDDFKSEFLISLRIDKEDSKTPEGILTGFFYADRLISCLLRTNYIDLPVRFSLLTEDKIVFASSDPSFVMTLLAPLSDSRQASLIANRQFGIYQIPTASLQLTALPSYKNIYEWQTKEGRRLAVIVPVPDHHLSLLLDIDPSLLTEHLQENMTSLLLFLGAIALLASLITLVISLFLSAPLRHLLSVIEQVGQGHTALRYKPESLGCEINQMGMSLNNMIERFLENMENNIEQELKEDVLKKEAEMKELIKKSFSSPEFCTSSSLEMAGFTLYGTSEGGDFFASLQKENQLFIFLGESDEKGLLAPLFSLSVKSHIESLASLTNDTAQILSKTNHLLCEEMKKRGFMMKALAAVWESNKKSFTYAAAGEGHGLLAFQGKPPEQLKPPGNALFTLPEASFTSYTHSLKEGDIVLLFTGGLLQLSNTSGELYSDTHLKTFLSQHSALSARELKEALQAELLRFSQDSRRLRDLTVVILKMREDHV